MAREGGRAGGSETGMVRGRTAAAPSPVCHWPKRRPTAIIITLPSLRRDGLRHTAPVGGLLRRPRGFAAASPPAPRTAELAQTLARRPQSCMLPRDALAALPRHKLRTRGSGAARSQHASSRAYPSVTTATSIPRSLRPRGALHYFPPFSAPATPCERSLLAACTHCDQPPPPL